MLEFNLIGNNSVGRMYRPHKILNSEKRGFVFFTKYKPNFGGETKTLQMEFNLEYNFKDKTEAINIDIITEDKTKVAVSSNRFESITRKKAKVKIEKDFIIENLRTLIKPDGYNLRKKDIPAKIKNDKGVLFVDLFIDSVKEDEKEVVSLVIYPSVINSQEYIVIDFGGRTPIVVTNENGVSIVD